MKRFALGLGIGILTSLAGVALLLTLLLRPPVNAAGAVGVPTLLIEHTRAKSLSLILEPGQATPEHTHEFDEIVICLESSKLRIVTAEPEPAGQTMQPNAGEVFMPPVKGVTHVLTN